MFSGVMSIFEPDRILACERFMLDDTRAVDVAPRAFVEVAVARCDFAELIALPVEVALLVFAEVNVLPVEDALLALVEVGVPPVVLAFTVGGALVVTRPELEPPPETPLLRVVGIETFGVADAFGIVAFVDIPAFTELAPDPALDVDFTLTEVFGVLALEPPLLGCTVAGLNEPVFILDFLLRP